MTTRSVPAGSCVSACQIMVGSLPDTNLSVRAMSRSRLMPGNTTTAAFIGLPASASCRHLNPVILDHRIGEKLVGGLFEQRLGGSGIRAFDLDVEHLALAH